LATNASTAAWLIASALLLLLLLLVVLLLLLLVLLLLLLLCGAGNGTSSSDKHTRPGFVCTSVCLRPCAHSSCTALLQCATSQSLLHNTVDSNAYLNESLSLLRCGTSQLTCTTLIVDKSLLLGRGVSCFSKSASGWFRFCTYVHKHDRCMMKTAAHPILSACAAVCTKACTLSSCFDQATVILLCASSTELSILHRAAESRQRTRC
jgi:hypothetical protein